MHSKSTTALLLLTTLLTGCATGAPGKWSSDDSIREGAWLGLHVVDWGQTLHIARNPDRFVETNQTLGEHPSTGRVHSFMATWTVLHPAISYALPKLGELLPEPTQRALGVRHWRAAWQYITIGEKFSAVRTNYTLDIKIDF